MQRLLISTIACAMALGGIPMLTGCNRTLEHEKTVEQKPNGQTTVQEKKVTEDSNGNITKTQSKNTDDQ
jgi:hypothetical protein